jgi:glycosyltransferase involved in cell wall biosynthesis
MLSILIPTYNYDCTSLVSDLQQQAQQAGIDYEIIVADDASPMHIYKEKNREVNELPHCRLIELTKNVGRARIRNRLAEEAQYPWLLFMDADAKVISPTYIEDYVHAITDDIDVLCGGLCHTDTLPSPCVSLRYAYEKRADKQRAAYYRSKHPYERFTPFNFAIRRATFLAILFDESISEYGHEDTLFGIELQRRAVPLRHIDNALQHMGLEPNEIFLEKTRAALRNLATMEDTLQGHSPLIKAYRLLQRLRLARLLARCYTKHETWLTQRLCTLHPRLSLLALYKLGYYCQVKSNED